MDDDQVSLDFWSWRSIRSVAILYLPVSACWLAAPARKRDHAIVDRNPTRNGSRHNARRHHLYCWKRVKYQIRFWNINHALIRQSVIFGALLSGIVNTNTLLLGCSGGDYCLILASFANVLLNLDHMHWLGFLIRFFPVALYVTFDIYETYQRYIRLTIINIFFALSKLTHRGARGYLLCTAAVFGSHFHIFYQNSKSAVNSHANSDGYFRVPRDGLNTLWALNTWIRVWDKSATRLILEELLLDSHLAFLLWKTSNGNHGKIAFGGFVLFVSRIFNSIFFNSVLVFAAVSLVLIAWNCIYPELSIINEENQRKALNELRNLYDEKTELLFDGNWKELVILTMFLLFYKIKSTVK